MSLRSCTQFGAKEEIVTVLTMETMEGWSHGSPANPFSLNRSPSLTRFWVGDLIFLPQGPMLGFATFRVPVTRAVQWLRAAAEGEIRKWYHPRRSADSVRGTDHSSSCSTSFSFWNWGRSAWLALAACCEHPPHLETKRLGMDGGARECACVKRIPYLGFLVLTLLTELVVAPLHAHLNELKYLKKKNWKT